MPRQQFGTFDNLEDRREIFRMLKRIGHGKSEDEAAAERGEFVRSLIAGSEPFSAHGCLQTRPTSPWEAYQEFVALTGVLGVPIEDAAQKLEDYVR